VGSVLLYVITGINLDFILKFYGLLTFGKVDKLESHVDQEVYLNS